MEDEMSEKGRHGGNDDGLFGRTPPSVMILGPLRAHVDGVDNGHIDECPSVKTSRAEKSPPAIVLSNVQPLNG